MAGEGKRGFDIFYQVLDNCLTKCPICNSGDEEEVFHFLALCSVVAVANYEQSTDD